jgi:hypothetical protein
LSLPLSFCSRVLDKWATLFFIVTAVFFSQTLKKSQHGTNLHENTNYINIEVYWISCSHCGEYEVQNCLLGVSELRTASIIRDEIILHGSTYQKTILNFTEVYCFTFWTLFLRFHFKYFLH